MDLKDGSDTCNSAGVYSTEAAQLTMERLATLVENHTY